MKVLLSSDQIQSRILEMGKQIAADYKGGEPHLVGVLKGACPFMTDLAQAIDLPLTLDYIAVSSYGKATKSSGEVKLIRDLDQGLDGRDLVVVEESPIQDLKVLYGTGAIRVTPDNKVVRVGGVKYTIKDGIVYDAKKLLADVRQIVKAAKEKEGKEIVQPGM